CMQYRHMYSF
nr:immunoglobulin light chain junction region [Macaca mulatta]MOV93201.1 immunoglobulin light chain junction region [Macaca mulatta]